MAAHTRFQRSAQPHRTPLLPAGTIIQLLLHARSLRAHAQRVETIAPVSRPRRTHALPAAIVADRASAT